jgi:imidazolonepropionase-like amidohydrolase
MEPCLKKTFGFRISFAVCILVVLCCPAYSEDFLIEHVRVFDGERTMGPTSVLVRNGKIESVSQELRALGGQRVIDGTGDTLIPGLIDAHAHVFAARFLDESLVFGVTTDLDMFMDPKLASELRMGQQSDRARARADLFSAGICATSPGGHGTEYGMLIPTLSSPDEAQAWVDARIAEGSDYIKIIYERGGDAGDGHGRPSIDQATLRALIVAAHARGKLAVVHIHTEQQAIEALEANADGLAHLFNATGKAVTGQDARGDAGIVLDPSFVPLVVSHHAFIIPTFSVLESVANRGPGQRILDDERLRPYLLPKDVTNLKMNINRCSTDHCMFAMSAIPALIAAHVQVLAGTDFPNPGTAPGASLHGELAILVEAGMTPEQALTAATAAPASVFHLIDRGRVAPGMRADLVLVHGDPTVNIQATRDIVEVWKAGVPVDRQRWVQQVNAQPAAEKHS